MATDPHDAVADAAVETPDTPPTADVVRTALARVTDPELDRSIVELDYVDRIDVETGDTSDTTVHVAFTLPTAWCSPAFAWMMACDARDAVEALPGVTTCDVRLHEHMHETEVNTGVNDGLSFGEAFPDADGDVAEIRATLDAKARMARQYAACEALLDAGLTGAQVARLRRSEVELRPDADEAAVYVLESSVAVVVEAEPIRRYLRKAETLELFAASDRLFRTPENEPITPDRFELLHRRGRLATVNMDGQGGVCDALHDARHSQLGDD